LEPKTPLIFSE
jgi:hypothetical protein